GSHPARKLASAPHAVPQAASRIRQLVGICRTSPSHRVTCALSLIRLVIHTHKWVAINRCFSAQRGNDLWRPNRSLLAAGDLDHLVAGHDLDARTTGGLAQADLVLVEAVPAVEVRPLHVAR